MKVIDASSLAALTFAEPGADAVLGAIDDESLAAPRLLPFELANTAWKKMRRAPGAADLLAEQLRDGLELPIALMDVDHLEVAALAMALDLTAYDASYLWLARALDAELVTLDKKLAVAARRRRA